MSTNKCYTTIFTLLIGLLYLSGCGAAPIVETPAPSPSATIETTPTPTLSPEEQAIRGMWRRSMHSRKETNVACESCHQEEMVGQSVIGVDISGDVCVQCHNEPTAMREQKTDPHSGLECTFCHDPHSLEGSCANSVCHPNVVSDLDILTTLAVAPNHETGEQHACGSGFCHVVATQVARDGKLTHIGTQHTFLSCAACHDALGFEVSPVENNINWNTWLPASAEHEARPFASHVFQRQVQCERCHFKDNPWKLRYPAGK